jgi:methyltransferase (TIGR00027 family)
MSEFTKSLNITNVTDTALWVAAYRAEESKRDKSLFKDSYSEILVGDNGIRLATKTQGSRYTAWSVVIRTIIIDQFIQELITEGIDTIINLGAGLDTRPYRLILPPQLNWIEIDFSSIITYKNIVLKDAIPNCKLERHSIDLTNDLLRNTFLDNLSLTSKKTLIITEGVIPYLSNEEAQSLAQSLYKHKNFEYWITEYYSPEILQLLRTKKRIEQMENSPFLFYPDDWFKFFNNEGWVDLTTKYFGEESIKNGRTPPTPGWVKAQGLEKDKKTLTLLNKYLGYTLYQRT